VRLVSDEPPCGSWLVCSFPLSKAISTCFAGLLRPWSPPSFPGLGHSPLPCHIISVHSSLSTRVIDSSLLFKSSLFDRFCSIVFLSLSLYRKQKFFFFFSLRALCSTRFSPPIRMPIRLELGEPPYQLSSAIPCSCHFRTSAIRTHLDPLARPVLFTKFS
jgi:hypothetical protein